MGGAKRQHKNCVLVLLTLSALGASSVFGQVVAEPARETAKFDVRGRPISERIILKLTRDAGRRLSGARAAKGRGGPAPVESALRQDVQDALQQWNSQRTRRVYPFKFAHPEMAAKLGLDRYYVVTVPRGTPERHVDQWLLDDGKAFDVAFTVGIDDIAGRMLRDIKSPVSR